MTITYLDEVNDSPHERFNRKGEATLVRQFKVKHSERMEFVEGLLFGGTITVMGSPVAIYLPLQYPGFPAVRVDDVDVKPFIENHIGVGTLTNIETHIAAHEYSLVVVTYTPLDAAEAGDQSLPDGTWAEYDIETASEFITLKSSKLKWEDTGLSLPADSQTGKLSPKHAHVVRWHNVTQPPWDAIGSLEGCVNENEWTIPSTGIHVHEETMLFMGAKTKKTFSLFAQSNRTWSLEYRFLMRAVKHFDSQGAMHKDGSPKTKVYGWNHQFRGNHQWVDGSGTVHSGSWGRPVDVDGNPSYPSGDFADLFAFEAGF
jgi:hypothetical protein